MFIRWPKGLVMNQELLWHKDRGGRSEEMTYPDEILLGKFREANRECVGIVEPTRSCRIAACVAIRVPSSCPLGVEPSMEQGQSELREPLQWDFPHNPEWPLWAGHIPVVQHAAGEDNAACTAADPIPPRAAISRIIAQSGSWLSNTTG